MTGLRNYLVSGASALALISPMAANAQTAQPAPAAPAAPEAQEKASTASDQESTAQAAPGLEPGVTADGQEIIVTANRRAESALKVPISISAYSQEKLDEKGILDISALARITPGLNVLENGFSGNKFVAIRGLSSTVGATMTGLYFDDTPIQVRNLVLQTNFYPTMYDLERVEVLRGPQGTLFGAGAMGGAVRFIQAKPSLTRYSGNARAELAFTDGGDPSYELAGAVGGPIVQDKLGFRASVNYRRDGGYVDRVPFFPTRGTEEKNENSNRTLAINASMTFKPIEDITITPSVFYQNNNIDGTSLQWRLGNGATRPQLPEYQSGDGTRSWKKDKSRIYSLRAQWDVGPVSLISNSSIIDRKTRTEDDGTGLYLDLIGPLLGLGDSTMVDLGGLENAIITVDLKQKSFAQEFRVQSNNPESRLKYVFGAFYKRTRQSHDDADFAPNTFPIPYLFLFPTDANGQFVDVYDTILDKQSALFGQLDWEVLDGLTLTAGLRYSKVSFNSRQTSTDPATGVVAPDTGGSATDRPWTPKFGVQYDINPNLMVYATAAKGFRGGGINTNADPLGQCTAELELLGLSEIPRTYKADGLWSYELGAKGRVGGIVSFAADVFTINWDDIQRNLLLLSCTQTFTGNFGKARSRGFEAQVTLNPARGLSFDLGVGYVDATQQETITTAGQTVARKGDRFATPWTVSAAVDYESLPVWGEARIYGHAQYDYKSGRTTEPGNFGFNPVLANVDNQHYVSARLGVRTGRYDLSAFVNNLTNSRDYLGQIHFQPSERIIFVTQRPRTFGITGRFNY